jgi:hypothetical protein
MPQLPDPPQAVAELWDSITFNDVQCPGVASVSISRANKWDTKKAQGSHGGERTFKGSDLASVKIQIKLWTLEQHDAFLADHLPPLEPDPGKKKPDGVTIGHAVATARNVRAITVDSVSGPEADHAGFVTYDIDATEYREPDKKNATGKATGGSSLCETIRAQLELRYADLAVQKQLLSTYLQPASFDPALAGLAQQKIIEIEAAIAGLENNLTVGKCREGVPFPATDYEAAEEIRDAA